MLPSLKSCQSCARALVSTTSISRNGPRQTEAFNNFNNLAEQVRLASKQQKDFIIYLFFSSFSFLISKSNREKEVKKQEKIANAYSQRLVRVDDWHGNYQDTTKR